MSPTGGSRARAVRAAAIAVAVTLAAAATPACRRVPAPPTPPNLLLISIDTLRADRLEAYGYARPTSPFLSELGARGLVFENAFANTHGTTPSHTTMLSGLHQETHRVGIDGGDHGGSSGVVRARIPDAIPLVQELLRAQGYTTIGVTGGGNAGGAFGFSRGFDHFDDRGGGIEKESRRTLWFVGEAKAGTPLFVFLHTYDVHSPYDPPARQRALLGVPEDAPAATSRFLLDHATTATQTLEPAELETISRLYDAGIRAADDALRALFSELETIGFFDHAVVIVTSDHGEEMGEHGGLLHRDLLYDVLIKVPLLVAGAGIEQARPRDPVSSVDIAPTLLALAGIVPPETMQGASLLVPRRRGSVVAQYGASRYALRTREWKLIWSAPGELELFDLGPDPGERANVAALHPEVRTAMETALERWKERHRGGPHRGQAVELTPDERRRLESLGYVR